MVLTRGHVAQIAALATDLYTMEHGNDTNPDATFEEEVLNAVPPIALAQLQQLLQMQLRFETTLSSLTS